MLFLSLHKTQHEKALPLKDLLTQLRLATTSSDTFDSARNLQLGKCTANLTRSDTAKQDYLQQELMKNDALLQQQYWSGQPGLSPERYGHTGNPNDPFSLHPAVLQQQTWPRTQSNSPLIRKEQKQLKNTAVLLSCIELCQAHKSQAKISGHYAALRTKFPLIHIKFVPFYFIKSCLAFRPWDRMEFIISCLLSSLLLCTFQIKSSQSFFKFIWHRLSHSSMLCL